MNFILRALRAVTIRVNSLLTSAKMLFIAGFVIIVVAILGALLDVLVRIHNYENGTRLQTGQIFHDLLNSLWKRARQKVSKR